MVCNYCGDCKRWKVRPPERQETGILIGDCDKIDPDAAFEWTDDDGTVNEGTFSGWTFEDECYDDVFYCFEAKEGN